MKSKSAHKPLTLTHISEEASCGDSVSTLKPEGKGSTLPPTSFFHPWERCLTLIYSVHQAVPKTGIPP